MAEAAEKKDIIDDDQQEGLTDHGNEQDKTPELDVEKELSPDKKRASKRGWQEKDKWPGDPDEWVSAKKFNERGDMIGQIRTLESRMDERESDFSARLGHQKKLHEAQLKVTIADLESKRDLAVDDRDPKRVSDIQVQIDDVKSTINSVPEVQQSVSGQNDVDEWNSRNPWIRDDSPKAAYALSRYKAYGASGKTAADAIRLMEVEVAEHFPEINTRRSEATAVESGRSAPASRAQPAKLSWNQLSHDELKWYGAVEGAWKNKEQYLKAVMENRSLEQ